jgi:TorA maturation chaperone TorD
VDLFAQETVQMARSDAVTLFDVMQAVREAAANEQETLASMVHLLTSGQVRLSDEAIRAFRDLFAPTPVAA